MKLLSTIKSWFNHQQTVSLTVQPQRVETHYDTAQRAISEAILRSLNESALVDEKTPKEVKKALSNEIREMRLRLKDKVQLFESLTKRTKTSKYKGVHFNPKTKRWIASITRNGVTKYLGTFDYEINAHNFYKQYAKKLDKQAE